MRHRIIISLLITQIIILLVVLTYLKQGIDDNVRSVKALSGECTIIENGLRCRASDGDILFFTIDHSEDGSIRISDK